MQRPFGALARLAGPSALVAALAFSVAARGSVVERLSLAELTGRAELIAIGTVQRVETTWTPDHRHLLRWVEVQVEEALKGAPGATLVVRLRGGARDGLSETVIGEPELVAGQRALLFVRGTPGRQSVVGMGQGIFAIDADDRAAPLLAGLALAGPDARGHVRIAEASPGESAARPLADLTAAIRAQLSGSAGAR